MDYAKVLDDIERAMGPTPRRVGLWQGKWRMRPPPWLRSDPTHLDMFTGQDALLKRGRLAWGGIVQANNILFHNRGAEGRMNAPADAIYSLDPASRTDPGAMLHAARRVYHYKHAPAPDSEAADVGAMVADEYLRKRGVPVPEGLSPDYPTLMTSIFVERRHLPRGKLDGSLLPMLVLPEETDLIMIAPHWFWPADFKAAEWSGR